MLALLVDSSDPLFRCEFGLRINVTVKESNCHGYAISGNHRDRVTCSGRGECSSEFAEVRLLFIILCD